MTTATLPRNVSASSGPATQDRSASESRVDRDSHFNGLYQTRQNLRIEGIAEGEIQCEGTLTVADGARVKAKVTASTVTIAGELEGEVLCQGIFQIMPTGQVEATVLANRLVIQEGGFFNGEFHMITEEPAPKGPSHNVPSHNVPSHSVPARDTLKEKPLKDKPAREEPSSSGSGLLSSDEWWQKMGGAEPPKDDSEPKPT